MGGGAKRVDPFDASHIFQNRIDFAYKGAGYLEFLGLVGNRSFGISNWHVKGREPEDSDWSIDRYKEFLSYKEEENKRHSTLARKH